MSTSSSDDNDTGAGIPDLWGLFAVPSKWEGILANLLIRTISYKAHFSLDHAIIACNIFVTEEDWDFIMALS